jgi:predicted GIY-YIG superfamily endonuclease
MAWVYMLRGSSGRYYIGSTTVLARRLEQHRNGHTHSTRRLGTTLELLASLEVGTLAEARDLERQMKQKKNPQLALFLLEQRRQLPSGYSSPENLRGWSGGQIPLGPPFNPP